MRKYKKTIKHVNQSKVYYILFQDLTEAPTLIQVSSQISCIICEYKNGVRISFLRVQFTFLVSINSIWMIYYYQYRL
jgi:hypothetical protein